MKRYETYKDSGIEWLGEIPNHWMEEKLKHIVSCNDDVLDETTDPEEIINYVEISDVDSINGVNNHTQYRFKEAPSRARRITKKGDVIVSTVRTYLKAIAPIKEDNLIVSTGFAVLRPRKIESSFVSYALQNEFFLGEVVSRSTGVSYPAINSTDLVEIKIPVPSADEQRIIASYLDDKVGQIDSVIAEKKKMVEDLQNYRKSVISEAVTRGLNPDVPMKDSGIDKFPQIPSHWNSLKLKYMSTISSGGALPSDQLMNDGEYEVYGGNGCMGLTSRYNTEAPAIIIGRVGALCGNIHLINSPKWVTDNALVLAIKGDASYEYVAYYLQAYNLNTLNSSNAQPLITGTKVLNVQIPIPSLEEQSKIVDYLNNIYFIMDTAISELQSQIEDLKSYKSSLITEAVTGKIDLR